jgi:hypothetical protein
VSLRSNAPTDAPAPGARPTTASDDGARGRPHPACPTCATRRRGERLKCSGSGQKGAGSPALHTLTAEGARGIAGFPDGVLYCRKRVISFSAQLRGIRQTNGADGAVRHGEHARTLTNGLSGTAIVPCSTGPGNAQPCGCTSRRVHVFGACGVERRRARGGAPGSGRHLSYGWAMRWPSASASPPAPACEGLARRGRRSPPPPPCPRRTA